MVFFLLEVLYRGQYSGNGRGHEVEFYVRSAGRAWIVYTCDKDAQIHLLTKAELLALQEAFRVVSADLQRNPERPLTYFEFMISDGAIIRLGWLGEDGLDAEMVRPSDKAPTRIGTLRVSQPFTRKVQEILLARHAEIGAITKQR